MLSFSTPPFYLENAAASVAAAASHYLHIWNESDGAAETSAAEDSLGVLFRLGVNFILPSVRFFNVTLETREALVYFQDN